MPMPKDVGIIDLWLGIPGEDQKSEYEFLRPLFRDRETLESFAFPAEYMWKGVTRVGSRPDFLAYTLGLMDRFGIEKALLSIREEDETARRALREHPGRFIPSIGVDPLRGVDAVREIVAMHEKYGIKAVSAVPAGSHPEVPLSDRRWYPIFAKLCELEIPFCCCVGSPGPRTETAPQIVAQIDEICGFFPELTFVMRHGAEPWQELAVKLMRKWPNLYYSTSAFAPKHYPKAIIDYANTRGGADKVMYAGYFPADRTLERIFADLPKVPFRQHVWPKFLRENAVRVFRL